MFIFLKVQIPKYHVVVLVMGDAAVRDTMGNVQNCGMKGILDMGIGEGCSGLLLLS